MSEKVKAVSFLQWVIENYCITGVDTFFHPDNIENDLTAEQLFDIYKKQKES